MFQQRFVRVAFFVISGYLITGGILRDLSLGRFTIRNFYHRRIRRIMPAYFIMIVAVLATGCALYYARPLIFLTDSVAAGMLFLANIYFWKIEGGYFSPQQHSQALLHLWSLSIEEQFYLFIPLLCVGIWKFCRRLVAPILALLAVLSLAGAVFAVTTGKQIDAFYFLHFRAWELLAGSLLAMLPALKYAEANQRFSEPQPETTRQRRRALNSSWTRQSLLANAGLLMLLIPYAVISTKTPFPGATALPSIIGTSILIRYSKTTWVARLLAWRPFVLTGKISYSLYLWHWPVTVFWKYAAYDQLYFYDYIGMLILSFVLGYLSWRFIEQPVRTSSYWTMRRAFVFASAGTVILVTIGTTCTYFKGFPTILHRCANEWAGAPGPFMQSNLQRLIRRIDSSIGQYFGVFRASVLKQEDEVLTWGGDGSSAIGCTNPPEILLIGDSHAGSLRHGLDVVLRNKGLSGYCISKSNETMFNLKSPATQAVLKTLRDGPQVSTVILAERWLRYVDRLDDPSGTELMYDQLEEFAFYIKSKGVMLLIVEDIPNYKTSLNEIVARIKIIPPRKMTHEWECLQQSESEYNLMQGGINARLDEICRKSGAVSIPLRLAFRENGQYNYFTMKDNLPVPLYKESNHLSLAGSLQAAEFIASYLRFKPN